MAYYGNNTIYGSGATYGGVLGNTAPLLAVCNPLNRYADGTQDTAADGFARIDLSWGSPVGTYTKYRVRRSMYGYPRSPISGDLIYEATPATATRTSDTHYVRAGTTYYYRVFVQVSAGWQIFDQTLVEATAEGNSATALKNSLPRMYLSDYYDTDGNYVSADSLAPPSDEHPLSQYMDGVGFWVDTFKNQAQQFISEPAKLSTDALGPKLLSYGYEYIQELPYENQRRLLNDNWFLMSAKGTKSAISAFASDMTGWKCKATGPVNLVPSVQDVSFNFANIVKTQPDTLVDPSTRTLWDYSSAVMHGTQISANLTTTSGAGSFLTSTAFSGFSVAHVFVSGTHAGYNLTFEGSSDGSTWTALDATLHPTGTYYSTGVTGVLTSNASIHYILNVFNGMTQVRVRATARTSGTLLVFLTPINVGSTCVISSPNLTVPVGSTNAATSSDAATQPTWLYEDPDYPNTTTSSTSSVRVLQERFATSLRQPGFGTNYPPMYANWVSGTTVNTKNARDYEKNLIPVEEFETYNFMYAYRYVTSAIGTPALANTFPYMYVYWYDAAKNLLLSELIYYSTPTAVRDWNYVSGAAVAPLGATHIGWVIGIDGDVGSTIHIGGVHIEKIVGQLINLAKIDGGEFASGTAQNFWTAKTNQVSGWPKLITSVPFGDVVLQMKGSSGTGASEIVSAKVPVQAGSNFAYTTPTSYTDQTQVTTNYFIAAYFTPTATRSISISALCSDITGTVSTTTLIDTVSVPSTGTQWSKMFGPPNQIQVNGTSATARAGSTAYMKGAIVRPATINNCVYQALNAGTSGSTVPTWPTTIGSTVTDGTVTWKCVNVASGFVSAPTAYLQLVFSEAGVAVNETCDIRQVAIVKSDVLLPQGGYPYSNGAWALSRRGINDTTSTPGTGSTLWGGIQPGFYKSEHRPNPYRDPRTINVVCEPDRINLIRYEDGSAPWPANLPASTGLASIYYSGTTSQYLTSNSAASTQASPWEALCVFGERYIQPGQWITLSTYVKLANANSGVTARVQVSFEQRNSSFSTARTSSSWTPVSNTDWVRVSVTVKVPYGYYRGRMFVQAAGLPINNTDFVFDGSQVELGRTPTDYFNSVVSSQDTVLVNSMDNSGLVKYNAQYFDKKVMSYALAAHLADNVPVTTPYRIVTADDVDWLTLRLRP